MKNIEVNKEGDKLTLTIDLSQRYGKSKGGVGKNTIVASSEGNVVLEGGYALGVNVYIKE